jgi:1,4-dihydroxy-2-naphthoate octaprenyltransferase
MTEQPRSTLGIWMQAVRAFSFTASMVPIFVGAMLALSFDLPAEADTAKAGGEVQWGLFPLVIVCSLLFHAGTNLVSDYFDFQRGVDRKGTFGSSGVLVNGTLQPKQILKAGLLMFGVGFLLGLILVWFRGMPIFWLGVIGLLGGFFYTGKPIGYKYFALGDFLVFTLMGPLMVIGSYYVLTGDYTTNVLYVSLPVGFLVAAILHANNLRDIVHDSQAHVRTMANLLGLKAAKVEYYLLVGGAYVSVVIMVLTSIVKPWALLVLLSLPPAMKNLKAISSAREDAASEIAMIDVQTAQHHFLFGLLLIVGLILSAVI